MNLSSDKELRDYARDLVRGQVKSVIRRDLKRLMDEEGREKLNTKIDRFVLHKWQLNKIVDEAIERIVREEFQNLKDELREQLAAKVDSLTPESVEAAFVAHIDDKYRSLLEGKLSELASDTKVSIRHWQRLRKEISMEGLVSLIMLAIVVGIGLAFAWMINQLP